jgi:hypothetical protein
MAVTASGLYYLSFRDMMGTAQLAVDLDSETTNKIALYSNSITPNFDTDTTQAAAPYNANECTGTNWAAGGVVLTTTAFAVVTGTLSWSAANVSVASTTLTAVRAGLIYGLATTTKSCICLVNFTSDYSTNNGTFAITWNGSGIFTIDLTP